MDILKLDKFIVVERYVVGDEGCDITFDANKFTGELGRRMARTYRECAERLEKQAAALAKPKRRKKTEPRSQSLANVARELAASMEFTASVDDLDLEIYADALAVDRYGILQEWGMTEGGKAIPPTFDVLMKRKVGTLKAILQFCRDAALPKKTMTPKDLTTSDSTDAISPSEADIPTVGSPPM